jgi:hypothetical protein
MENIINLHFAQGGFVPFACSPGSSSTELSDYPGFQVWPGAALLMKDSSSRYRG